jgi:hypothetical protein
LSSVVIVLRDTRRVGQTVFGFGDSRRREEDVQNKAASDIDAEGFSNDVFTRLANWFIASLTDRAVGKSVVSHPLST